MKRLLLVLVLLLAVVAPAEAASIRMGKPGYGGTGCPQGTASVNLSGDGTTLSLLFDRYQVEAGGPTRKSFDRKSCNLAIPLSVPSGLSVSVLAVDYRGFNALSAGARSVFQVEYFFANAPGPVFSKTFTGPTSRDFYISNKVGARSNVWSACGADVILRTNSSIRVNTAGNRQAMATVDSQDIKSAIVYRLQYRRC